MKKWFSLVGLGMVGIWVAGCARITSQVVEKPRLDQESTGNRGYLMGSPKGDPASRKTTRTILQTDIELATASELNPWRMRTKELAPSAPLAPPPVLPQPEVEMEEEEPATWSSPLSEPRVSLNTYTVKKGDTLEKIAQKFYGNSRTWRRIYEANRDAIKAPNRIYPGQELVIPEGGEEGRKGSGASRDLK